jgi:hypothetical protein
MRRNSVSFIFCVFLSLEQILASGDFENNGNRFCRQDKKSAHPIDAKEKRE